MTNIDADDSPLVRWGDIARGALDNIERAGQDSAGITGLPTGFPDLDELSNGLQRGRLSLVAGLSGMGKSVLLGDFFRAWMRDRIPSVLVSPEMGREEIWRRQAAAACRVNHDALNSGRLYDEDWSRLARWITDTAEAPSWVFDQGRVTLPDLRELVLKGVAEYGWQGVVVDYAQKIHHRAGTREREVAEIAVGLKELAREADVAMVVGAQINRESTKRTDKVPKLSDLRESAALEHEADLVILVHRPDYDDAESPRAGEADLIVAKNRAGARNTVTVAAQLHFQRFMPFVDLPPEGDHS